MTMQEKTIDDIIRENFYEHNQDREILTNYKTIKKAMVDYAQQQVKNLNIPAVSGSFQDNFPKISPEKFRKSRDHFLDGKHLKKK